ncbi:hypothetical protein B0T24DRAFT_385914 [Lasiosphaeria ovina]|uniref:Uncharacterized protein n=1 Tax=Lasiosphaeria ovina TaxID=92902 RepID=A0AAE0JZF8_9PEZI|nr:hypothetical protein B0T24DRAFT_385914 [Lasiosphaeria ovina]
MGFKHANWIFPSSDSENSGCQTQMSTNPWSLSPLFPSSPICPPAGLGYLLSTIASRRTSANLALVLAGSSGNTGNSSNESSHSPMAPAKTRTRTHPPQSSDASRCARQAIATPYLPKPASNLVSRRRRVPRVVQPRVRSEAGRPRVSVYTSPSLWVLISFSLPFASHGARMLVRVNITYLPLHMGRSLFKFGPQGRGGDLGGGGRSWDLVGRDARRRVGEACLSVCMSVDMGWCRAT